MQEHRGRLLKELAARLKRDTQLSYAARELEMQRLLMGKGGRQKIRGVEKVEGDDEDEDRSDDDVPSHSHAKSDEQAYRPRVYKWRMERKK
jgi:U3 small nucleolar RNA-associated protein 11